MDIIKHSNCFKNFWEIKIGPYFRLIEAIGPILNGVMNRDGGDHA